MEYLKSFLEHKVSIFDPKWFGKFLPETLEVIASNTLYKLKKNQMTMTGNLIRFSYWQRIEGQPCFLIFDIHMVKDNDGTESNLSGIVIPIGNTFKAGSIP